MLTTWAAGISVHALDVDLSNATITADNGGLVIDNIPSPAGYFMHVEGVYPGNRISRSYIISNKYTKPYELYLKAAEPASIPEELDLANKIQLCLTLDGKEIYNGSLAGGKDAKGQTMENTIFLGTIHQTSKQELKAVVYFPGELGNEYQNAEASVQWEFTAITKDEEGELPGSSDIDPPPSSSGESGGTQTGSTGTSPKTGDGIPFTILCVLAVFAFTLAAGCTIKRKKMKLQKEVEMTENASE